MRYFLSCIIMCCLSMTAHSQYTFKALIRAEEQNISLAGATVSWKEKKKQAVADSAGFVVIDGITAGPQTFLLSHVGFEERMVKYNFPLPGQDTIVLMLTTSDEENEDEVIVTATRTSRTIANTPTRIEVISGEELQEKGNMRPGEIRMMLNESTGIQTQQTSATSFNAGIRIQGLDGRYTQILRDGYPLYSGFSGGLSILQIAPLDLRQVEVIKGSSSTLYGGGAIAGLVNLVSKTPTKDREISFVANATSALGLDLSGFYSERYGKSGLTVFASRNTNAPFDPAGIGLTAIPKFERYTINPRLFLYGKKTTADIGISFITEDRTGGNVHYIKHGGSGYFEENNTDRITAQSGIAHRLGERSTLQLKNSYSRLDRGIAIPGYRFDALQQSSFSELSWTKKGERSDWVIGGNIVTDDLEEERHSPDPARDYHYTTYGIFIQNAWSPHPQFTLESGLRGDYVKDYGFELLPRVSAMLKISPRLITRLGGGFGYKTPTVFTEESERIQFQHLLPIDRGHSRNERSVGGNWDVNYSTRIGDVGVSINHLFFYTKLTGPLVLQAAAGGMLGFQNSSGYIDTKGMETNLKLTYGHFRLFVGYTYTDAHTYFTSDKEWMPLTAHHRLNNVLMYEIKDNLKLGLEGYYFSRQLLNDGKSGKSYWTTGFMIEKYWKKFSVFINLENFTNTRQTKFDTIFTGTVDHPIFRDIYAPVEGFIMNGGIKLRL